jgi:hypothetical protein
VNRRKLLAVVGVAVLAFSLGIAVVVWQRPEVTTADRGLSGNEKLETVTLTIHGMI